MTFVAGSAPPSPDEARKRAQEILNEKRFQPPGTSPAFVRRWLDAIGDPINDFFRVLGRLLARLFDALPGTGPLSWLLWTGFLGLAAVLFLVVARAIARRGQHGASTVEPGRSADARDDAPRLEGLADEAEREGRFGEAVRLRFAAGLARLEYRNTVRMGQRRTNRQVAVQVGQTLGDRPSAMLVELGEQLDNIVHGGFRASADDAQKARSGWEALRTELHGTRVV